MAVTAGPGAGQNSSWIGTDVAGRIDQFLSDLTTDARNVHFESRP